MQNNLTGLDVEQILNCVHNYYEGYMYNSLNFSRISIRPHNNHLQEDFNPVAGKFVLLLRKNRISAKFKTDWLAKNTIRKGMSIGW